MKVQWQTDTPVKIGEDCTDPSGKIIGKVTAIIVEAEIWDDATIKQFKDAYTSKQSMSSRVSSQLTGITGFGTPITGI